MYRFPITVHPPVHPVKAYPVHKAEEFAVRSYPMHKADEPAVRTYPEHKAEEPVVRYYLVHKADEPTVRTYPKHKAEEPVAAGVLSQIEGANKKRQGIQWTSEDEEKFKAKVRGIRERRKSILLNC
ncbi:hypothetical protein F3Y22_tig00007204pilonHSYRG00072 [Hibiscus syriacus]|uniref:Uncharacterized protein n=1 Tax=Hibiscus syriacus TaxID=106335 RepID=A0A6A3CEU8_HIBSY|nr:hypothetical protein F3Y22_tig00007204pilonHSYRG00072 [Hibiscus syriacus]